MQIILKSGSLNFLEPSGLVQACLGIVLHLPLPLPSLPYSMEQSHSWEANRFSANQEIRCILCNQKVLYRVLKMPATSPHPEPDLSSRMVRLTFYSITIITSPFL